MNRCLRGAVGIRPRRTSIRGQPHVYAITAVGKKNWLFVGGAEAGQRSAILFTIIANGRRLGINPFEYLRDVLTRLLKLTTSQTHTLTPAAWAEAQAQLSSKPPSSPRHRCQS